MGCGIIGIFKNLWKSAFDTIKIREEVRFVFKSESWIHNGRNLLKILGIKSTKRLILTCHYAKNRKRVNEKSHRREPKLPEIIPTKQVLPSM